MRTFYSLQSLLAGIFLTACFGPGEPLEESMLSHAEGAIIADVPGFFWHRVPEAAERSYIRNQLPIDSRVLDDPEQTAKLQAIVDLFHGVATGMQPKSASPIPRPKVVIVDQDSVNAFVTYREVCVRQKLRVKRVGDGEDGAQAYPHMIDLGVPGQIRVRRAPTVAAGAGTGGEQDTCEVYDPSDIEWDAGFYVDAYNGVLAADDPCRLSIDGDTIVASQDSRCGRTRPGEFPLITFRAQSNILFVHRGLTEALSESAAAISVAHELAHMYRAHASPVFDFEPYFFEMTPENELRRPLVTDKHPELQEKLLAASALIFFPKTEGVELDPNLFDTALDAVFHIEFPCLDDEICAEPYDELLDLINGDVFRRLSEKLEHAPLKGEERAAYLKFEELLLRSLEVFPLASLPEVQQKELEASVPEVLSRFFEPLAGFSNLSEWLRAADARIDATITGIVEPFERSAELGLGYYTTEEEADEIAVELAVRAGYGKEEIASLWLEQMDARTQAGRATDSRETAYDRCEDWRENGWLTDAGFPSKPVKLGSLYSIHHGFCYRLLNTDREWHAHFSQRR